MSKKQALQVNQTVWLETTGSIGGGNNPGEKLFEMTVLEANKSKAYIWYNGKEGSTRFNVNQKTHDVRYAIPDGRTYRLWLSKEEYEQHKAYYKEKRELLHVANEKINKMTLEELRNFTNS